MLNKVIFNVTLLFLKSKLSGKVQMRGFHFLIQQTSYTYVSTKLSICMLFPRILQEMEGNVYLTCFMFNCTDKRMHLFDRCNQLINSTLHKVIKITLTFTSCSFCYNLSLYNNRDICHY